MAKLRIYTIIAFFILSSTSVFGKMQPVNDSINQEALGILHLT